MRLHPAETADTLREQLERTRAELQQLSAEYVRVEAQLGDLMKLHVSARRLHECATREELLEAVREILITVVGTEEFALIVGPQTVLAEPAARAAGASRGAAAAAAGPVACIPMRLDRRPAGTLVIHSLLPHKPELEPLDRELLDLLAADLPRLLERLARQAA